MRFSYHWLQTYFSAGGGSSFGGDEKLPEPKKLADLLTFHSLEVEEILTEGGDAIFEIAVLPNRRHDCLSHRGIAREISVLTGIPLSRDPFLGEVPAWNAPKTLVAEIQTDGAPRYMAAYLHGISVGESPDWLKERLRAIGQKPINNIVDATNYIMFELGQPLHAFDAEKFVGEGDTVKIGVRNAKEGEQITVLGGTEYILRAEDLVIVDGVSDSPLGIAGIKGGTAGEITPQTKNIIIESANFDPARIRATATRLGLRTDASLRFESGLAPEQAAYALKEAIMLIEKLTGATLLGVADIGKWNKKSATIPLSSDEVNKLLGTDINESILLDVLGELKFSYTNEGARVVVTPPFERLDVETKEDLIEEVGRVYGYEKIAAVPLPVADKSPAVNKNFYYAEQFKDLLIARGAFEIYTHAIGDVGKYELENPLAEDKRFLRESLRNPQFDFNLYSNFNNTEVILAGENRITNGIEMFELGKVFDDEGEHWELAIGGNFSSRTAERKMEDLLDVFGLSDSGPKYEIGKVGIGVARRNFDDIVYKLPEPQTGYPLYQKPEIEPRYRPISQFPFVLRDIAVFVPEGTDGDAVRGIVKNESGKLLVGARLLDRWINPKDGKLSYAFRLVFQSHEKTLTDSEVNDIMKQVTDTLNAQEGFTVR